MDERIDLEWAHHEIRTALTVIRSNVALVRIRLSASAPFGDAVREHLEELDGAVDRLLSVARDIKRQHNELGHGSRGGGEASYPNPPMDS